MEKEKVTYYLIREWLVGKRVEGEESRDYLFKGGEWVPDEKSVIMDHLVGFDKWEPEDSPYRFGNLSIMAEIEQISCEEAEQRIKEQKEGN